MSVLPVSCSRRSSRSWSTRALLALVVVLLLTLPALAFGRRLPDGAWSPRRGVAATESVPKDPALTVGTLPNGMRYYIRVNRMPALRAELRLVVNAGSALEDEDQRGFAHFLEHMAFNGTTHFPKHDLIEYLETAGMRFGADLNAYTSFDETVYKFTVPTDDPQFLSHGLQMLADLAGGGITIDSSEVVAERGVIMGEWRSRLADTATQAVQDHGDSLLYGGASRYLTRRPIGDTTLITHAQPGPIRRFYHDWYRPDLMAIVVVGDVDKATVERWIRTHFGVISAPVRPVARVSPLMPSSSEPAVSVYRGQVIPAIDLVWKEPPRPPDAKATAREALIEQLLFEGLSRRFLRMREEERRPFFSAEATRGPLPARRAEAEFVRVVAWPDSLESGLAAALGELERVARYGVPQAMFEQHKAALLRQFESAATAEAAVPSVKFADEYTQHYLRADVALLSPAQELALARELLPTITPRDLARAARFWRRRSDLVVSVSLPTDTHARPPTRKSLLALFDSVSSAPLSADSPSKVVDAPLLEHLPTPGRIVGERRYAKAGVTEWALSNGARVLLKPTGFNADELLIKAVSPGGFSLVPDSLFFSSGRLVGHLMTEAAGVGTLDRHGLDQKLATTMLREFKVAITNNDESIALGGSPKDMTTLFQLLYLQFTAPKLDTAAIKGWRQVGTDLSPSLDDNLTLILSRGDPRRSPTPWALIPFADGQKAMEVYRNRFGNASDFTFLIVGNVTPAQARPLVERYLASLPGTGQHETAKPLDVRPWNEVVRQTQRGLQVPKASTLLVFDGLFPSDPEQYLAERRRLSALGLVLQLELTDELRERMGGTYGVGVRNFTYLDPAPHYRVEFTFDAAPDRMDEMTDALLAVLDSVRARGAPAGELTKAAAIQRRTREVALQDNHYWLQTIEVFDRLRIPFDRIAVFPAPTLALEDVRAAARQYLPATSFIHLTVLPQDTSYLAKDSTGNTASDTTIKRRAAFTDRAANLRRP